MINLSLINESQAIVVLIVILDIWLGFWVYFANQKSKINQSFFLLTLLLLLWAILCYFKSVLSQDIALILVKLAYGAVALFYIPFYFFLNLFPKKEKGSAILSKIIFGVCLFLFFFSFSDLMAVNIELINGKNIPILGTGRFIYLGLISVLLLFITLRFLIKYLKFSKKEKTKAQYFLVGLIIFILINFIFNIILPLIQGNAQYSCIGNHSAIFLLGFTAYAIVKRELFDIKIVLTSLFVFLIAILLSFDILFLTSDFLYQVLKLLILAAFLCFGYFLIRSVLNEIKRRKELEHLTLKLERANARLEDLIKMKEEFLHITSHQLRTPLTAIRGMISMWCAGDFKKMPKKDRNEMMKRIYLSTERLNNITNDMIDAMELEGRSQLKQRNFKQVSLVKIIQDAIETLKTNFEKNNLYINFKHPKKLPEIQGDENYLSQIFLNLIDNAQKYTLKGGVDVSIKKENNFLVTEIADTGMGVSKEDEKCLFKKFSRGKRAEQFYTSGTGLGIFIAKKVIEEHQGKISVFSEGKNKGTTFKVWLPIRK